MALPSCKYGASCYRRSAQHLRDYYHPPTTTKRLQTPTTTTTDTAETTPPVSPAKRRRVAEEPVLSPRITNDTATSSTKATGDVEWQNIDSIGDLPLTDRLAVWRCHVLQTYKISASPAMLLVAQFAIEEYQSRTGYREWTRDHISNAMRLTDNLRLCGPFDVLCGRFDDVNIRARCDFGLHCRYSYDTPESCTVAVDDAAAVHYAEWRDVPGDEPHFIVAIPNESAPATVAAADVFQLVYRLVDKKARSTKKDEFVRLRSALSAFASRHSLAILHGRHKTMLIPTRESGYLERKKRVVSDSLIGVGIVVPYDRTTDVGFRPMPIAADELTSLIRRMELDEGAGRPVNYDRIDELTNLIAYANDECDPGCGLLFWQNVYSLSRVVERDAAKGLALAYRLLARHEYARIIIQHVKHRERNVDQIKQIQTEMENQPDVQS